MSTPVAPRTIKGFADLHEPDSTIFTLIENTARRVFGSYGYKELRTPILEYTELFSRGIGTETDIVQKEMFTFPDRKGRSLTMRPEATAGVMRSYIENKVYAQESVSKFFTFGPMFRYERPQKGRMRQFHQLNCECIGAVEPEVDAETMLMVLLLLKELKLTDLALEINTLGCSQCRPRFKEILVDFLKAIEPEKLCEDCRRRVETNPLRVLDCKSPGCRAQTENAPHISEHVCPDCAAHFSAVRSRLDEQKVPYILNHRLVRGLDYYSRTTFEVTTTTIGSQGTVAGGGRYDGLVAQLGGPDAPGIGFACGMERLALMMGEKIGEDTLKKPDFFIAVLEEKGTSKALFLAQILREAGLSGEMSFAAKSLKSQMRQASKSNVRYCLLLGGSELEKGCVVIKNMESGEQVEIAFDRLGEWAETVR